ncbi:MAG: alpha/beta hydrolase [Promethearchaeota archaeon]
MVSKGMERVIKLLENEANTVIKNRLEESRKGLEQLASLVKLPKDVNLEHIDINGMAAVWISSPGFDSDKVVLYFHGGGYIEGSLNSHQDLAMRIGRAAKARVLLIDYRLAPEDPFPAAVEDAVKSYKWLIENQKIVPNKIVIAGDSAGGGLTLVTLIKLRDDNINLPAAGVCLSPWTDVALTSESLIRNGKVDPFLKFYDIAFMADLYVGDNDPKNPYISPLYADLHDLPPILIQVGTAEIIEDDSVRFAEKAKKAGVDVKLEVFDDMIHVFQAFADWAPEGQDGIDKIGTYIQEKMS